MVVLSAEHGPARRYRAFLTLLLGRARVVVGTRAAAFAPVHRLGLAAVWDDGDNRLEEPHAPYSHTRTVLALRSTLEGAGLLIGGFSRSVEAQSLVEQGWCQSLVAPRHVVRNVVPRVEVPGPAELDREALPGRPESHRSPIEHCGAPCRTDRFSSRCHAPGTRRWSPVPGAARPLTVLRAGARWRWTIWDVPPAVGALVRWGSGTAPSAAAMA